MPVRPCLQCCGLPAVRKLSGAALARLERSSSRSRAHVRVSAGLGSADVFSGQTTLASMLDSSRTARQAGLLLIANCLVAPVSEDFAMRGFLFRGWSKSFWARSAPFCLHRRHGRFCTRNIAGFSGSNVSGRSDFRLLALSRRFDLAHRDHARRMEHRGHGTDRVDGDRYLSSLRRTSPRWPRASTSRGTTERGHATSAIAIGMVMAAKMVWSVMICATLAEHRPPFAGPLHSRSMTRARLSRRRQSRDWRR